MIRLFNVKVLRVDVMFCMYGQLQLRVSIVIAKRAIVCAALHRNVFSTNRPSLAYSFEVERRGYNNNI